MKEIKVNIPGSEFLFSPRGGGFPTKVTVAEFGGATSIPLQVEHSPFSLACGGEIFRPVWDAETTIRKHRNGDAAIVDFPRLKWRNAKGMELSDLSLSLRWEIHSDGAVFCDIFLFYATLQVPVLQDFKLSIPLDFQSFDDVKWGVRLPPETMDATIIQAAPPERFLSGEEHRTFPGKLFTQASFNAMRENGPSFYAEFFLEGSNSLFNRELSDTESSVHSSGNQYCLEWNFQKQPRTGNQRPLHWRNRFGFLLRTPPTARRHKPYSMIHYIDNFQRYPTPEQIKALTRSGIEVLILHDCWRLDTQNGGNPYDEQSFRTLARNAHAKGIRLVVYVRGNEISVTEDAASWFDSLLKKDFDGIYMDYGGPAGYFAAPDENYPGGRTEYRRYYLCMKALRERVGENGLFYSHTGPVYSGLATSFFDGYVSGEGERGILVRGRREHEYFSMSAVSPGTMWTAAFPEYSSRKMIPFLASTAQAPHLPIGKQIESSSLRHPPVPGISDSAFQELLDAWHLLKDGTPYEYYTDYNSCGLFETKSGLAHCVLLAPGKKDGIFLLANTSAEIRTGGFELCGFLKKYRIQPLNDQNATFEPYEIRTALLALEESTFRQIRKREAERVHIATRAEQTYRALLELQKRNRHISAAKPELRVFLPSRTTSHEQSLWEDLYNIVLILREECADGSLRSLGYLSRVGLTQTVPTEEERLRPGERSVRIDLGALLGKGPHKLQIYSEHLGEPFYSFPVAEILDGETCYPVEFMNELEEDRAVLHWELH